MSERAPSGFAILRAQHLFGYQTRFRAVCTRIGDAIGHPIEPFTAPDYGELTAAFEKGQLGLAWVPPVTAARLARRQLALPIAIPRRHGSLSYSSVIITHEDGVSDPRAIPNPRIGWVDPESAAGYLAARGPLLSQGVAAPSSEHFFGSHASVVDAVAIRAVDLAATFATYNDHTGAIVDAEWLDAQGAKLRPVKAIARFATIPNDCIVVSTRWPLALRAAVQAWLFGAAREHLDILASLLRTEGFAPVDERWHAGVEHILAEARAQGIPELGTRRSHDLRRHK